MTSALSLSIVPIENDIRGGQPKILQNEVTETCVTDWWQ